jgi:ClpP class serine protease
MRTTDTNELPMTQEGSSPQGREVVVMQSQYYSRWKVIGQILKTTVWVAAGVLILVQLRKPAQLDAARAALLNQLQEQRRSRVIAMIHGEDTVSLFGVPVSSSIDMEDSESILRAIRLTPPEQPIDFILHTPGGLALAAEQIAHALIEHRGKVTVFVPDYSDRG